ncbi:hypothetical protein [Streptomyces roseolus]|uniref:hypothetical protein n=1 Tax=Streptomyces roseolus TaxID=67358 RepID=UPI0016750DA4|nr:hypothetical protein [Streptomyces roseolus]
MNLPRAYDEAPAPVPAETLEELLALLRRRAWADTDELRCAEPGHPDGHVCMTPPEGEAAFDALRRALVERYGRARDLARDGDVDPYVTELTGLPLLTPFGDRVVGMRGWSHGGRWIGLGAVRGPLGVRPVLVVAEGRSAAAGLPEGATWLGGVLATTGRDLAAPRHAVDWAAEEARLGTALPVDYKQLAEAFGEGAFDGWLRLYVPGSGGHGSDLVGNAFGLAEHVRAHGGAPWEPYAVYPAPGGLLQWGDTEQADTFYWLTEGRDPDRWPIVAVEDDFDSWVRFDGTITEFLYRLLTDRHHPFSTARYFDRHWFEPYGEEDGPDEEPERGTGTGATPRG